MHLLHVYISNKNIIHSEHHSTTAIKNSLDPLLNGTNVEYVCTVLWLS